jgi:ferredoxin
MTLAKYKIIYDRKKCMGAAECEALNPLLWAIAEDQKADLIGGRQNGKGQFELTLDDGDVEQNRKIARSCPMGCISIAVV